MGRLADRHPDVLRGLAERYGWDGDPRRAVEDEVRLVLRTMSIGVWEDVLDLERLIPRAELVQRLAEAPPGALSPRAWSFWHYRLGLTAPGEDCPPAPERVIP